MVTEPKDVFKELASSDTESQWRAVRCLKNEIIGNPNRKQCFIQLGAVPRIIRMLAYPAEQRLAVQAAAALGSFAYQNTDGVAAIVEGGGVAHLMKALSNSDFKLVEAALRSLKMIFQSSISPRDVIFLHPAFDRLVDFMDIKEKSFAEDTLIIFAKCCQTKQQQELLLKSGALSKMTKLLFSPVMSIQFAAMEALDKFSERNVEVCETVTKRDDVIKTLMRFVRGRNIRVKMAACSLLSNLSVMVPEANAFSMEVTEVLVQLLDESSVSANVPGTLADIASNRMDLQKLISRGDGFRKLWKMLKPHDENTIEQIGVIRALGVMCQHQSSCRREIVTSRTILRILSFLDSDAFDLRFAACLCFESIVAERQKRSKDNSDVSFPVTPFSKDPALRSREFASTALAVLISEQQDPDAYYRETLDFLVPCAWDPRLSVRYKAVWGLGEIIRITNKEKCEKWLPILDDLLWNCVRDMIQDAEDAVQNEGLRFLESMVIKDVGIQTAIDWSNGELLPLIAQKLDSPNEQIIILALSIAAAVANSAVEHQTAVMGSGVPPRLLSCLEEHCSEAVKLAAVRCVINLTYRDVLPLGGEDHRLADSRAMALLELGIEESLTKLQKAGGSEALTKRVKDAINFLGQLD